ncbi:PQQ-binding-like beta-propeller repeat protein [Streptomyces sp. NPDC057702]|uniref:outer membrane protein assembly factor BamB family protein n=1 Tax=unclassified Streptomyces TaxID=2593676 RepID=UPI0036C32540
MSPRVLPDEPFPEVGTAFAAALSADGQWLAVLGYLGGAHSPSRTVKPPHGPRATPRVVLYRRADLACQRTVAVPGESVDNLAFHPVLPLLAVGTNEGDEYARHGTLLLVDVVTGRQARVVCADAGVAALRWRDGDTLDVLLTETDPDLMAEGRVRPVASTVRRPASGDWLDLGGPEATAPEATAPGATALDVRRPAPEDWSTRVPAVDVAARHAELRELAASVGRDWSARRAVWAVAPLRDGRVLAVREDSPLECWSPEGQRVWAVPRPTGFLHRGGLQLQVTPDEHTARVTVDTGDSASRRTHVLTVRLADGSVRTEHRLAYPALLTARADGLWAARDTCELFPSYPSWTPSAALLFAPDGTPLGAAPLGRYDPRSELTVRRSPHLFFLVVRERRAPEGELSSTADPAPASAYLPDDEVFGTRATGGPATFAEEQALLARQERWLARVTPGERNAPGTVQPLFALGPKSAVHGGPAVYVSDAAGPALILATTDAGTPRLTRRSLPDGEPLWSLRTDSAVAGLDVHAGTVYAARTAGDLLAVDAATGTRHARHPLTSPEGHTFTPVTLATTVTGDVVIGTLEGRLLVHRGSARDP